eukprot:gnl/TRDRNA2_/TRDRNA2_177957_c1_seq10.p2 gnl/TRDRNA2_/TRDRNA2_177957_c1~~gnl/TRDRNA2_/TRDRNA2_177957_c1_seq10.p2  ORF type:complete len:146 (+),score=3.53 gnl/TRDRNA2_/TRDRNA2_177957_c1_seq10:1382-1819(+)
MIKYSLAFRLAEISVAIRAAQTLSLYKSSLLYDLRVIIHKNSSEKKFESLTKYFEKHLEYYEMEQRNLLNADCSIDELITLAHSLNSIENFLIYSKASFSSCRQNSTKSTLLCKIFAKMALTDLILRIRVKKNEAMTIYNNKFFM